jgi:bifunctional UDP-N-acetylglucosamine pyrophosphorylase/glucosamine-1-phosphate N-acetyltransferase
MSRTIVVLAAGLGTRMRSPLAKVLHPIMGRPLLAHLLETLRPLGAQRTVVVVGHQAEAVAEVARRFGAETVVQEPQRGTGHALMCCRETLGSDPPGEVLLVAGDVPLLPLDEIAAFWDEFSSGEAEAAVVSLTLDRPHGYGRILRDDGGHLHRIVEEKDARPSEKTIAEVNSGVYFLRTPDVFAHLETLGTDNAQGEFYLTDVFARLAALGSPARLCRASDPERWLGVNSQSELAHSTQRLRRHIVEDWMARGVTVLDPDSVWVEPSVRLEPGVVLHPHVRLCGETVLGACSEVRSFSVLHSTYLGPGTLVKEHCVLEETKVGAECLLGPFCHTREGTILGDRVHLGNFVETKKAALGEGVKANHLSYLGDATVGAGSNIGAGTITCNYDGLKKHPTVLGDRVFVGSDTQLVAPVTVGDGAYIGAGTTVTKSIPAGALAISRAPQRNIEGWATRKRERESRGGEEAGKKESTRQ